MFMFLISTYIIFILCEKDDKKARETLFLLASKLEKSIEINLDITLLSKFKIMCHHDNDFVFIHPFFKNSDDNIPIMFI